MRPYGHLELTAVSPQPAFQEPIDVEEAKTFLRCQTANDDEHMLIYGYIVAARVKAEEEQGRDLVLKQYDLRLDSFCGDIQLRTPLQSVDLVQYTNSAGVITAMVEGADYSVDLARGLITTVSGGSWPYFTSAPSSSGLIRFTSGYPRTHPYWSHGGALVRQGMIYLITEMYWKRIPEQWPEMVISLLRHGAVPRVL